MRSLLKRPFFVSVVSGLGATLLFGKYLRKESYDLAFRNLRKEEDLEQRATILYLLCVPLSLERTHTLFLRSSPSNLDTIVEYTQSSFPTLRRESLTCLLMLSKSKHLSELLGKKINFNSMNQYLKTPELQNIILKLYTNLTRSNDKNRIRIVTSDDFLFNYRNLIDRPYPRSLFTFTFNLLQNKDLRNLWKSQNLKNELLTTALKHEEIIEYPELGPLLASCVMLGRFNNYDDPKPKSRLIIQETSPIPIQKLLIGVTSLFCCLFSDFGKAPRTNYLFKGVLGSLCVCYGILEIEKRFFGSRPFDWEHYWLLVKPWAFVGGYYYWGLPSVAGWASWVFTSRYLRFSDNVRLRLSDFE